MRIGLLTPVLCGVLSLGLLEQSSVRGEGARDRADILIGGVHCEQCVARLREAVDSLTDIRIDPGDVQVGRKPRYWTDPIELRLKEQSVLIGQVAKAVADRETPHAEEAATGVFVVLYTPDPITETRVIELRAELREVNGLEVMPGQLGGFPKEGYYWVRLEDAGGADLGEIITAARKANDRISLTPP